MNSKTIARQIMFATVAGLVIAGHYSKPSFASDATQASFNGFSGSWAGTGTLSLTGGNVESLKCKAYYTPQNNGQGLGVAIRCASASSALELRAALTAAGETIKGNWEERTYNASGAVSGGFGDRQIDLAIKGGAFNGSMRVTIDGGSQKVAIQAEGSALKAINLSLTRM